MTAICDSRALSPCSAKPFAKKWNIKYLVPDSSVLCASDGAFMKHSVLFVLSKHGSHLDPSLQRDVFLNLRVRVRRVPKP